MNIAAGSASQKDQCALTTRIAHRVRADGHETGLAEVDDAGVADVELEPQREQHVGARQDPDARPEAEVR